MNAKIYPDSGVELNPFIARNYDKFMNVGSIGLYRSFIKKVICNMKIGPEDEILDLGCGTGRNANLMRKYLSDKGHVTGLDISEQMEKQFLHRFNGDRQVDFINLRIDQPFNLNKTYDKVFISFVIHGFPHEVRDAVIKNAFGHLKHEGIFYILDFSEFNIDKMPWFDRFIFEKIECKYAFDYIKRDWREILHGYGFGEFAEHFYLKKYVRLLKAVKQ
jgi:demethylmenaquinone methyltransferase/2-methoxy-6-polyprenyl-1,4-benzoquinol methylase